VGIRNGDQWEADEAQKQVELWDPATGQWRLGPPQAENRAYHSIAMLLPDGRVISAGDDVHGGTDRDTAEIYEPPYLFKGARPTITWAPGAVRTGTSFEVDTPDANITRATLIAPSAVTHAADMNERSLSLSVSQRAGGVTLTAPASAAIAPDGYYMLFLLTDQGVPSVAKWVRLSVDGLPSALPEQPRPGPPTGTKPKRLSLSRAAGARLARRALAKEFGRVFRKRTRFRQRCTRPKRAVVSCSVSWVFKTRKHFKGRVKVTKTKPRMSRYSMRIKRNFAGRRLAPVKRRGRLRLKSG
jgi:Galactose oxidase-like, Early set domain